MYNLNLVILIVMYIHLRDSISWTYSNSNVIRAHFAFILLCINIVSGFVAVLDSAFVSFSTNHTI